MSAVSNEGANAPKSPNSPKRKRLNSGCKTETKTSCPADWTWSRSQCYLCHTCYWLLLVFSLWNGFGPPQFTLLSRIGCNSLLVVNSPFVYELNSCMFISGAPPYSVLLQNKENILFKYKLLECLHFILISCLNLFLQFTVGSVRTLDGPLIRCKTSINKVLMRLFAFKF